jgi:5,6-dimethylbenzimidazole synthase
MATDCGLYDALRKRRTVRRFQARPIEYEKVERIIAAGFLAPSSNHLRKWHFILLKDLQRRKDIIENTEAFSRSPDKTFLTETLKRISNEYQREVYSYSVPLQEKILLSAPELMVICYRIDKSIAECRTPFELNRVASIWLAIENVLLAMTAEGLAGVTMVPFETGKTKAMLSIPDDYEVATFLAFGYPEKEPEMKQVGIELHERIHIDAWRKDDE